MPAALRLSLPSWTVRAALLLASTFVLTAWATALFGNNPALRFANAVALVVFLSASTREWPHLALLLLLGGAAGRVVTGTTAPLLTGMANVMEVLLAAGVIHLRGGLPAPWYQRAHAARLLAAWLGAPVLSAAAGALAVGSVVSAREFVAQWWSWYSASALGMLVVAPVLLSWFDPSVKQYRAQRARTARNLLGTLPWCLAAAALMVQEFYAPLLLLTFPVILLVTWRSGLMGATAMLVTMAAAGVWSTLEGRGATVEMVSQGMDLLTRMQALQLYLAAMVMTSLPFAALLSHQRQLLNALRRSSAARSQFFSAMSHEIRTPMTGVLGLADLLASEPLQPRQQQYVSAIRASGQHLLSVINDILDFSRIESGKLPLEVLPFSILEVLEQVRSLMHPLAVERGLSLRLELDPHLPPAVLGDPTRLRQVLINLAGNAVKFTPQGEVVLSASAEPAPSKGIRLHLAVRDTGIGIETDKLGELFQPFSQVEQSTARRFGGTGLGLAICKRLIDAMGGSITVESVPGRGSTFRVDLPLEVAEGAALETPLPEAYEPPPPSRILIAEDVEVNREILRTVLEKQGHTVVFAVDGQEAVQRVEAELFDLVLMDVQMPVMDGVEATRRIRQLPGARAHTPVIGLTANVMAQEQRQYLAAGMNECQMKPVDWHALNAAIARYARARREATAPSPAAPPPEHDALAAATAPDATAPERPATEAAQAAAAQPQGAEVAAAAQGLPPLIDARRLHELREFTAPQRLGEILRAGVCSLQDTAAALAAADVPLEQERHLHRLRGTAATLAFARVAQLAESLEAAARAGEPAPPARLHELQAALEATADAVAQEGLVAS
ncbi:ATP-binding protein [Ramlibacter sp. AN1015]|uniref:ATP-binding protein n=1 Tax=Ramlibacter sp. AN1015 TaxID=3133428 RepID=UPI0030BD18C1